MSNKAIFQMMVEERVVQSYRCLVQSVHVNGLRESGSVRWLFGALSTCEWFTTATISQNALFHIQS